MKKVFFIVLFGILSLKVNAAAPTTQASAITFANTGCNSFIVSCTKGNGAGRIIVVYPGAITNPTNGTTYTGNYKYGSGSALGGGSVVYAGTSNSVTVIGLAASTIYTVTVFEYNTAPSTAYNLTVVSSTITTTACTDCPVITAIMLDACDVTCTEGNAEFILFNSCSYGFDNFATSPSINYGTTPTSTSHQVTIYEDESTVTTTMNGMTGCSSGDFVDANNAGGGIQVGTGVIPAWSTFMIATSDYPTSNFCPTDYDFTNICATYAPIYVLYGGDANLVSTGNWLNHTTPAGTIRYFGVDFTSIAASCNVQYYQFDANSEVSGNGAGVTYTGAISTNSASPTTPNLYTGASCTLPTVLPIGLLNFYASKANENINLKWATSSETNNSYFVVEYSLDAANFIPFKEVRGAGTSTSKKEYGCVFNLNLGANKPYFRLKQVDYNGDYKYSNVITIGNSKDLIATEILFAYHDREKDKIVTKFHLDYPQQVNIDLYDVTGVNIYNQPQQLYNEGDNEFIINTPEKAGIYFVLFRSGDGLSLHKKIVISK